MKQYETLIFDLDDTLIDNYISAKFAFEQTLKLLSIPYNDELFESWLTFEKQYWGAFERNELSFLDKMTTIKDKIEFVRAKRFVLFFKPFNISLEDSFKINEYY